MPYSHSTALVLRAPPPVTVAFRRLRTPLSRHAPMRSQRQPAMLLVLPPSNAATRRRMLNARICIHMHTCMLSDGIRLLYPRGPFVSLHRGGAIRGQPSDAEAGASWLRVCVGPTPTLPGLSC